MRIWLDDIRSMPEGFDWHCKTAQEVIDLIDGGKVTFISFDHDLGEGPTGYSVALHIEMLAFSNTVSKIRYAIHSANPVGAQNIKRAMINANRFWYNHKISNQRED